MSSHLILGQFIWDMTWGNDIEVNRKKLSENLPCIPICFFHENPPNRLEA